MEATSECGPCHLSTNVCSSHTQQTLSQRCQTCTVRTAAFEILRGQQEKSHSLGYGSLWHSLGAEQLMARQGDHSPKNGIRRQSSRSWTVSAIWQAGAFN